MIQILIEIEREENSGLLYTPPVYKNSKCYYFRNPVDVISIDHIEDIKRGFESIQKKIDEGYTGIGLIAYELGYYFEETLENCMAGKYDFPLVYFAFYDRSGLKVFDAAEIDFQNAAILLNKNRESLIEDFHLSTSKSSYMEAVGRIKDHIAQGNTYQVNYTVKGKFKLRGKPFELFLKNIFNQSSEYSAFFNTGGKIVVSASPEKFFEVESGKITVKPMKGTISRGINEEDDEIKRTMLADDPKNQAENIMIVDLLRNDIGRISELTSVSVDKKFSIQTYESLHQMTSSVSGKLKEVSFYEILKNIFPCGSITGAPKIRTMQLINELETEPRGLYTGAIGFAGTQKSLFNVAIRTTVIDKNTNEAEIGLGSGIVWDSDPKSEYDETMLKSDYLREKSGYFELLETMLIESGSIFLLEYHLQRLKRSADYFLFKFDENEFINTIDRHLKKINIEKKYKCRILLNKWGSFTVEISEITTPRKTGKIKLSAERIYTGSRFQYFKTTNRGQYNTASEKGRSEGFIEVIFLNERGELAEGAITNLVLKINGKCFTPPIKSGVLNGCYRQYMIDKRTLFEKELYPADLRKAEEIILINSVAKEIYCEEVVDELNGDVFRFKVK